MLSLSHLAILLLGAATSSTLAAASPQEARIPDRFVGPCDYSPIGLNAPHYNCGWFNSGGLNECRNLINAEKCYQGCSRVGGVDRGKKWTIVADNNGDGRCQCRCKLR